MKLMLELIDKVKDGYIIYYSDFTNRVRDFVFFPYIICDKLKTSKGMQYEVNVNGKISRVTVLLNNNKYIFELGDDILSIPAIKFDNNKYKAYTFQTYINIQIMDSFDQVIGNSYRFLKNYDTKFKARYYTDKFSFKFANLYKKYFIGSEVVHDLINSNNELYNGDIVFEHNYLFHLKNFNGRVMYSFIIVSVEKG